jgi:deoxyribodipyrimidine photo-lyase
LITTQPLITAIGSGLRAQAVIVSPIFVSLTLWIQQKKFDPDCVYISRWISELSGLAPKMIHAWNLQVKEGKSLYPAPMVDHAVESKIALQAYRRASKNF